MNQNLIEVKNLTKIYPNGNNSVPAVNDISFNVTAGEFIAVMGPSGCGKSTLLNILGMLDNPTEGEYIFDGKDISKLSEGARSRARKGNIGFVFQNFNLIDELTVYENVEMPLMYLKVPKSERHSKITEVLDYVQIKHLMKRFPYQLSGGEQQRAALARALVFKPKLILADEPTGNLDLENSNNIMKLLKRFNDDGITIILVTHEPDLAKYCKKIIKILDGQLVGIINV